MILQVCLSPAWGGLEMVAFEFAQVMSKHGRPCVTLAQAGSRLEAVLKEKGLRVETTQARKYFSPQATRAIRHLLQTMNVKTIAAPYLSDLWFIRPALIGRPDVRLIGFAHMFLSHPKKDPVHHWLYARVDELVCLTERHRENVLANIPYARERTVLIPNSVDIDEFGPERRDGALRELNGVGDDDFLIGVVGRLDPLKGQIEMIEAMHLLRARGRTKLKLWLIGGETHGQSGLRKQLEDMIVRSDLRQQVRLLGQVDNVQAAVASLDLLVMPSYFETFGRVLIEAMASEVPVIGTDAGGVADVIEHEQTGLLAEARNPDALAMAIERVVNDQALATKLKTNGAKHVREQFSRQIVEQNLLAILDGRRL